jgi:hypothetical protein
MSDDAANPESHNGKDLDPGEPVGVLATLEHEPSANFLGRIRRTIQRRTSVSQIASFSWNIPFVILMEFWLMLTEQLNPKGPRKERQP